MRSLARQLQQRLYVQTAVEQLCSPRQQLQLPGRAGWLAAWQQTDTQMYPLDSQWVAGVTRAYRRCAHLAVCLLPQGETAKAGRLGFVAGLIPQEKLNGFERLLFRCVQPSTAQQGPLEGCQ